MAIADAAFKTSKVKRNLKLFISNSVEEVEVDGETIPGWCLRIEGKLETYGRHGRLASRKLSHYFHSLHVEFEQKENEPKELVEWINGPNATETDGWEIRRSGLPFNKKVIIVLRFSDMPTRFKLSEGLANVLSMQTGNKPEVILALWQYIKLHKLQESDEKKQILNDAALKSLFRCDKMAFSDLPNVIHQHLLPLDPVHIEYDLDLEHGGLIIQDVEVELEDPSKSRPAATPSIAAIQREIGLIDQRISECVSAMKTAQSAARVLQSFAKDPITCANTLISRQIADLEMVVGEDLSIVREDLNKASAFDGEDIDQAVTSFLQTMRIA